MEDGVGAGNAANQPVTGSNDFIDGQIIRLNETSGFGYVKISASTRQYFFKLCRIEGHKGRSMREMGIQVGTPVGFRVDAQGRVTTVRV